MKKITLKAIRQFIDKYWVGVLIFLLMLEIISLLDVYTCWISQKVIDILPYLKAFAITLLIAFMFLKIKILKHIIDKYWWCIFIIFYVSLISLACTMAIYPIPIIVENILGYISLFSFIILATIPFIISFPKPKIIYIITYILLSIVSICVFLIASIMTWGAADKFTHGLKIPENIVYNKLRDRDFDGKIYSQEKIIEQYGMPTEMDLIIYGAGYTGYGYEFYYKPTETGKIYLKAFEITKSTQLSAHVLDEVKIDITEVCDTLKMFTPPQNDHHPYHPKGFIIYEGGFDKYYVARFEVWFIPSNGNPERKIFEKNYIIDGWDR